MSQVKLPKIAQPQYNSKNLNDLIETRSEQADIVNAINSGYLIYPSAEFILSKFQQQSDFDGKNEIILSQKNQRKSSKSRSLPVDEEYDVTFYFPYINYLNVSNVPIIEIGDIFMLKNLRILDLSDNHLKSIEPLNTCINLLQLDLNGNQVF